MSSEPEDRWKILREFEFIEEVNSRLERMKSQLLNSARSSHDWRTRAVSYLQRYFVNNPDLAPVFSPLIAEYNSVGLSVVRLAQMTEERRKHLIIALTAGFMETDEECLRNLGNSDSLLSYDRHFIAAQIEFLYEINSKLEKIRICSANPGALELGLNWSNKLFALSIV